MEQLEEIIFLSEFHAKKNHAKQLTELDDQFHEILYDACQSKMLKHQLKDFHEYVRRVRKTNLSDNERSIISVSEHKQIMEAIRDKDEDRAAELANLHMRNAYANMLVNGLSQTYEKTAEEMSE